MPLTERSRHKLYETFTALIDDEEAVEEMLSYFPARDVEEPVTKDFLRAELQIEFGALRSEIGDLRAELHTEIGGLRAEMRSEIGGLRAELHTEIGGLRTELHTEIGGLRAEMLQTARATQTWIISTGLSLAGLILAVARFG